MVTATSENLLGAEDGPAVSRFSTVSAQRHIRVLHVFSVLGVGGAETWLMSLLRYFKEQNDLTSTRVSLDVLLTGGEKAHFDDEAVALGAKLFYVPFTRRNLLSFTREFRKILAEGKYDVIHDHQDYIAAIHFLIGRKYLPRVRVAHIHNARDHREKYAAAGLTRRFVQLASRRLLPRLATYVLGTSEHVLAAYGLSSSAGKDLPVAAVHCGFDLLRYQGDYNTAHSELCNEMGWQSNAKVLLFVGRLSGDAVMTVNHRIMTQKNPEFALETARLCIQSDQNVRLVMAGGDDARRRDLEAQVELWGLSDVIRLVGTRPDLPRLMLGADLLLFPSISEGLGMSVVEAQAAGLRALVSDTTPRECVVLPQLVNFYSLEKSPAAWADKALSLLYLERINPIEANSAVRKSDFSIENSAARLLEIYRNNFTPGN